MDKRNLYYIVKKGTNDRIQTIDKRPYIAESDAADLEIETWAPKCEKISIADYEEKFEDKESE